MPCDFWELTPQELNIIIEIYSQKHKESYKEKITVAFYNAYFQRVQKMPKLENILNNIDNAGKKKEMSDEEMFRTIKKFAVEFGGE